MSAIEVLLTVPDWVQSGLTLGQFERVGGVVREVSTGRVVAWLRDGVAAVTDGSPVAHSVLHIAGVLSSAGFVLNLALTTASLSSILVRLGKLQSGVGLLQSELERERDIEFQNALEDARDAVEMTNEAARQQRANNAISALRKSSVQLHQAYSDSHDTQRHVDAAGFLVREMYAVSAMVRCYLELDEVEVARQRLSERITSLQHSTRQLVASLLGDHPAAYLHKDIPDAIVRRFSRVAEWYYEKPFVEVILTDLRPDFWNDDALTTENAIIADIARRLRRSSTTPQKSRYQQLDLIESLIENIRRVEGFELELRSMRLMGLSFVEWANLTGSEADFSVIIPEVPLNLSQ